MIEMLKQNSSLIFMTALAIAFGLALWLVDIEWEEIEYDRGFSKEAVQNPFLGAGA